MVKRNVKIGLRQAHLLCQMSDEERLAFIAEGLALILASSQSYWKASEPLAEKAPREASVLQGLCIEEAAKILILMDMVRCPTDLKSKIGKLTRCFYSHFARRIYAEATHWQPTNLAMLRDYVDRERRSYYLEGYVGECIMPNWTTFERESQLYVDVLAGEDNIAAWSWPFTDPINATLTYVHPALDLAEAMSALGLFKIESLHIIQKIWSEEKFTDRESCELSNTLNNFLIQEIFSQGLLTASADESHVSKLRRFWQMPMYALDFEMIEVSLEDLREQRDALIMWQEF